MFDLDFDGSFVLYNDWVFNFHVIGNSLMGGWWAGVVGGGRVGKYVGR